MSFELGDTIPKGFLIKVTTWENDGDDYKTEVCTGLNRAQAIFLYKLAEVFGSNGSLGNEDFSVHKIAPKIIELMNESEDPESIEEYMGFSIREAKDFEPFFDHVLSFLKETILSYPVSYDYDFCRVVERIDVFFIEEEIKIPSAVRVSLW